VDFDGLAAANCGAVGHLGKAVSNLMVWPINLTPDESASASRCEMPMALLLAARRQPALPGDEGNVAGQPVDDRVRGLSADLPA